MTNPEERAAALAHWRELEKTNPVEAAYYLVAHKSDIVAAQAEAPPVAPTALPADPARDARRAALRAIEGEPNPVLRAQRTMANVHDFIRAREEEREFPNNQPPKDAA